MNFPNTLTATSAFFIFFVGIYVYKVPDHRRIKIHFLILSSLISIWLSFFIIRQWVPIDFRQIALDWMLIPTIFFPTLLDQIASLIPNQNYKISKIKFGILSMIILYLLWAAFTCSYSRIEDKIKFSYSSTIHYHILISYIVLHSGHSIYKIFKFSFKFGGDDRVRFVLMNSGIFIVILASLIFLYVLPIMGFFAGYLTSIAIVIAMLLWAVAILQFDAFETKAAILAGEKLPTLNKITLPTFLTLFKILDPMTFRLQNFALKKAFALNFLNSDFHLKINSDLGLQKRAELLARKYDRYIR